MLKGTKFMPLMLTGAMLINGISAAAAFESYNDPDGFTLGHYTEEPDAAARQETERLYESRPKNERRFENLTRGLTAVPAENGTLVSWRFLGTDSGSLFYNLYCNGEKLNSEPITTTNFFHTGAPAGAEYTLCEVVDGKENGVETTAKAWDKNYIGFKVTERDGYNIDDGAVADLDGDGEYEILLRRVPSMDVKTRTSYPLIEAYRTDGTHMWTINIGPNEINEHDLNILAYDMNGDGKSEVIMRSFEGTEDGAGNIIGDTNNDGKTDYSKDESNLAIFKDRQYVVSTPEFLSVYDGVTGAEMDRTELLPSKEPLSEWSYNYTDTGRLTKRASHFLFGLAYLDGVTPSVVVVRGAWDQVRAAAWHLENNKFKEDWQCVTPCVEDVNSIYGACNHNLAVADIDFDGKDEILSGPMAIDHDGTQMYAVKAYDNEKKAQKLGHGDAFDTAKMDPDFNGYLTWACHESSPLMANIELHDARTGQIEWGYSKNKDTGRSRAADIDPTKKGFEVWGSTGMIPANINGENLAKTWNTFPMRKADGTSAEASLPMNFKVYWDGDLLSELLDGISIYKYNWEDNAIDTLMTADGCASNCGTKAVPCASADLFGDWREEIVWKTADEKEIRIYSTSIPTSYKLNTLMHDSYYRASVAMQNNHYNQPPNVSYYLGAETKEIPIFEGYVEKNGKKLTNPDLTGSHGTYPVKSNIGALSVKLAIGTANAYSGRTMVKIDPENDKVVPVISNDRTLVPVRFIAENLGMDVAYDNETREVKLTGNGYTVKMTLDKTEYTVNDIPFTLDVPARSVEGRTMIPLRAMAEAVGMTVEWDQDNKLIYIGSVPFYDNANAGIYADALKSGKEPEPTKPPATPEPVATPDPILSAEFTSFKDSSGKEWKIYIDEDFESKAVGDTADWAGTKKPGILDTIAVAGSSSGKTMQLGGAAKGSRNADWHLPYTMTGNVRIELDWKTGACKGGDSYGELRFADSSNNVFLALKTKENQEMQYATGGAIANGGLETGWQNVGSGFAKDTVYHIVIEADFDAKVCSLTVTDGALKTKVDNIAFDTAANFSAMEVLAVRQVKNFDWMTELDNIKIGIAAK